MTASSNKKNEKRMRISSECKTSHLQNGIVSSFNGANNNRTFKNGSHVRKAINQVSVKRYRLIFDNFSVILNRWYRFIIMRFLSWI